MYVIARPIPSPENLNGKFAPSELVFRILYTDEFYQITLLFVRDKPPSTPY